MVSIVHCPKLPFFPLGNWAIFLVFAVLFSKSAPMQVELAARILTRTVSQTSPAEGPLFTLVKYSGFILYVKVGSVNCLLFDLNRHKIIKN